MLRYVWDEKEERWAEKPDEFAIGLKEPHRSTEGGVALNYGYDPDGNVDYDQCRATLWTTGEHLREAEGDRVYEGGARIIHGLQGNDKGAVRPANLPPYDSWFVDNDGLYLDAGADGHVGDIAIFNPCDKRSVAEPEPLPFPEEYGEEPSSPLYPPDEAPDLSEPGIYIDKECYPGIFGGELHCEITVTNVGETLSDPIDLYDAATLISGPGAGGAVIVTGVTPDGPDWFCSPTPTPDLWCSLPADALDPGETRSIEVFLDTGPLFAAGNFGFLNCAELDAPWHDTACDEGGTDITVTKTAPAACVPGADCTFTVTITNTGAFPFSGPVQFSDNMFVGWPFLGPFSPPITVDRPCARLRAAPCRDRILVRGPPHARARRVRSLRHHGADAAGGSVPRLLGPKLLRGLGRGRGGAGFAACPRRRQPDDRLRLGAGRRASGLEQSQNGQAGLAWRRLLQGWPRSHCLRLRDRDFQ